MKSNNSRLIKQPVISFKRANQYAILKFRKFFSVAAMALGSLALSIYSGASWAQTYYVDATNGNDSWQGSLPDAQGANGPWKTLSKVNDNYFAPGDSVLLKCGQTWNETLVVTNSGVAGSPITYGAYGNCDGINKPIIDGSMAVNAWTPVGASIYAATANLYKTPLNLLSNGSFDADIAGWGIYSSDASATSAPLSNCGWSGGCLFFTPSGGASAVSIITTPLQSGVEAGVTYRVTFVARASQAAGSFWVFLRDGALFTDISASNLALTTAWQTYAFDFTPTASHASARIDFQMPPGTNLYLDNVVLKRVTPELDTAKQVFLDGQYQRLAQYPNKGFMPSRPTNQFLTIAADSDDCTNAATPSTRLIGGSDLALTPAQQADLVGAGIHYRFSPYLIEDRTITAFNPSTKTFSWVKPSEYAICKNWGYYLDNKLWMLDTVGEWYYDMVTRELRLMPTGGTPDGRVSVGHLDYGVNANQRNYIVIENISIQKTVIGISGDGSNIIVRNTDIADSANRGISIAGSLGSEVTGCHITNSAFEAIMALDAKNTQIKNNTILNTGVIGAPKRSLAAIMSSCWDCGITVGNVVIEGNDIRNSGYIGIYLPVQAAVRSNYVAGSCLILDDCGAIYTNGHSYLTTGVVNNSQITNNIVVDVLGNPDGRPVNLLSSAQGIYLDNAANTVKVTDNTVVNADHGVQIHNGASNTLSDNVIYGSRKQTIWMQESSLGELGAIHNNSFTRNRYFQLNKEYNYLLHSVFSTINFADYSANRYSLLYSNVVAHEYYKPSTVFVDTPYPYQDWVATKGEASATAFNLFQIASSRVVAINSGNLVSNGSFDSSDTGWSSYTYTASGSSVDVRKWESLCVTGGCLNFQSGSTQNSLLISPNFTIRKDRTYLVRMDLRGLESNQNVNVILREGGKATYNPLGLNVAITVGSDWQTHTFVFVATADDIVGIPTSDNFGARLDLQPTANQTIQIDNVLVEEVTTQLNDNAATASAIITNPTLNAQPKDCPDATTNPGKCSQYVRFTDGTPVSWPITVSAMGSEIVVWNNNPFKDTDRDKIADLDDLCPGTPAGTPVNERGCSFLQQHSSDLGVTLVAQADVLIGDVVTYTITVNNSGPSSATNVVTSGSLPFCSLGILPNGGSATCTRTVTANTVGALTQTVSVGATENDGNTANNTATAATAVLDRCAVTGGKKISGTVNRSNGTPSAGVNMLLIRTSTTPQCGNRVTTGSNGGYSFTEISKATYSITPSKSTCASFTPKNRTVSMSTRDISGQNFTEACP